MGHVLPFVPLHVSTDTLAQLFGADADRARVLAEPGAGALLFDWLHLASLAGIQAVRDAALDQVVPLPADADERSRGAWACDVLALAAHDPAWRAVLARVRATASRDRPAHASYDARLTGRVAIGDARDVEQRIARELASRLAPMGLGRDLRVRVTLGAQLEIAVGHDETSATAFLAVQSIAGDTAVRLHVLARPLVGVYLAALGSALAASPIARRQSVSLFPIAQRRAAVLVSSRATSAELAHVRAIALEWDGDDDRGVLRGHDVLASAERRGMRLENGALVEVVLRLVLRAAGAGVVDVWVREPDEVTLSDERHLPLVRRLRGRGRRPGRGRRAGPVVARAVGAPRGRVGERARRERRIAIVHHANPDAAARARRGEPRGAGREPIARRAAAGRRARRVVGDDRGPERARRHAARPRAGRAVARRRAARRGVAGKAAPARGRARRSMRTGCSDLGHRVEKRGGVRVFLESPRRPARGCARWRWPSASVARACPTCRCCWCRTDERWSWGSRRRACATGRRTDAPSCATCSARPGCWRTWRW